MAMSGSSRSISRQVLRSLVVVDLAITYPLLVLVGVLAALGMLRMGLVGTTVALVGSAALGIWVARTCRAELMGRSLGDISDASAVAAATVGVTACAGWTQIQHKGAVLGLMAVCCGGLVLQWRLSEPRPLTRGKTHGRAGGCRADDLVRAHELADLLGRLPTDVLLAEWQRTGAAIAGHPGLAPEAALVRLRAMLLDELEARNGEGFSAWQRAAGRRPCSPVPFLDGAD